MAWLFLDTHESGHSRLGWIARDKTPRRKDLIGRSHKVLGAIAASFPAPDGKLEGVCVVKGPGSFSSVRTGVLYANVLARFLRVPLVGVTVEEALSLTNLQNTLFKNHPSGNEYVAPVYDCEPHITIKKFS
jgi:tRNA A37 threonylcarbamoyladenosine modification protein TsaB